ncbi:hypothetical protein [uncultured Cohaesibacter sp.]|uniref:hypothetical protein n=1 Tax=uncultured Cohaesibacter sp. TaxID=1002546 RepID=UPI0029C8AB37|nr:hypothetical protein [uncultured Cohaesibacter sp.]
MSKEAGSATISDLARHLSVCRKTAEKIADYFEERCGLRRLEHPTRKYHWEDIWELEGSFDVLPKNWHRMKAPLLRTQDLYFPGVYGRSERTIRRRAAEGTLKSIKLPIIGYRFRESEVEKEWM